MPLQPEHLYIVKEQMKDEHVTPSIYPYEICSWMLYHSLTKSTTYYQTVQQRIDYYRLNTPVYTPVPSEKEFVNRVVNKIQGTNIISTILYRQKLHLFVERLTK